MSTEADKLKPKQRKRDREQIIAELRERANLDPDSLEFQAADLLEFDADEVARAAAIAKRHYLERMQAQGHVFLKPTMEDIEATLRDLGGKANANPEEA